MPDLTYYIVQEMGTEERRWYIQDSEQPLDSVVPSSQAGFRNRVSLQPQKTPLNGRLRILGRYPEVKVTMGNQR